MYPSRVYARIDLDAIVGNITRVRQTVGEGVAVYAVIKANAYGHGALQVAGALKRVCDGFAVATAEEALHLRQTGIGKPILILGYAFSDSYKALIAENVALTVFDYETALEISAAAAKVHKNACIHIKVDTGMGRIGFLPDEKSIAEIVKIAALPHITVEGMFSHFACADEKDKTSAKAQLAAFTDFADKLKAAGVMIPMLHMSNSAGITDMPDARFNMVRCGISTYGLYPSEDVDRFRLMLEPAMSLHAFVTYVKTVPPGTPISYGSTFVTDRETVVATVPIGYADGYPRSLSGVGYMMIRGKKAPILGRVCMDQCMVDVTDIPGVCRGDEVILIGKGVDTETVAALSGRLHYELICDIGVRVPRIYHREKL